MPEKYRRPHHHERVQTVERMRAQWEAERDALATVRRFNARLSAKRGGMVLAEDRRCANRKASLACDRVRQLRDCG